MGADTTRILSRIGGPFLLITGAALLLRGGLMPGVMEDLATRPLAGMILGLDTLLIGLVVLALRPWRGWAGVILGLLGVLLVVRGALLLLAPGLVVSLWRLASTAVPLRPIGGVVVVVLGLLLTFAGYFDKSYGTESLR
jgi:hypothetical protein